METWDGKDRGRRPAWKAETGDVAPPLLCSPKAGTQSQTGDTMLALKGLSGPDLFWSNVSERSPVCCHHHGNTAIDFFSWLHHHHHHHHHPATFHFCLFCR